MPTIVELWPERLTQKSCRLASPEYLNLGSSVGSKFCEGNRFPESHDCPSPSGGLEMGREKLFLLVWNRKNIYSFCSVGSPVNPRTVDDINYLHMTTFSNLQTSSQGQKRLTSALLLAPLLLLAFRQGPTPLKKVNTRERMFFFEFPWTNW